MCRKTAKTAKSRADGQVPGPVKIVGALRWPDTRHWFTPNDDAAHNLWFNRDPHAIAAAKGLGAVAPFFVEMEAPVPPGGLPSPGKIVVNLPDNHLQYAITWYGLAAALAGVFVVFAFGSRGTAKPAKKAPLRVPCEGSGFSITVPYIRSWGMAPLGQNSAQNQ